MASMLVADCPRGNSRRITFDVLSSVVVATFENWQNSYETFCVCRHCHRLTVFVLIDTRSHHQYVCGQGILNIPGVLNDHLDLDAYVGLKDQSAIAPPKHIPEEIEKVFIEGATCLAVGCYNAAGTMFRLCVDLTTRSMLPAEEVEGGPNKRIRRNLGLRLPRLFENNLLPRELEELSSCIKEDGNDRAHAGTLERPDAEDLLDFTVRLLDRIYSEPECLRLAQERRMSRRSDSGD